MPIRRRGTQSRARPRRRAPVRTSRLAFFEGAVERAIDRLPAVLRPLLDDVAIVVEDEPSLEQLRTSGLDRDDTLYGLYEGTPPTEYAADWVQWPNKITLFRFPLEDDFPDPDDLEEEVRVTIVHELAHHAGFDERRLHELGMD